jgi:hypothetical protein
MAESNSMTIEQVARQVLAVQVFPLSDVKAHMGHADIATTMIYVHHVPQLDAADRLSKALAGSGSCLTPALAEER